MNQEPLYEDTEEVHIPHDLNQLTEEQIATRAIVDELYRRYEWWNKEK